MTIQSVPIPPISAELINKLDQIFPELRTSSISTEITREELFVRVGQRQVVDWLRHHAGRETTINGRPL